MAKNLLLLIGPDTKTKTTYVQWEVEEAYARKCTLIGVNLLHSRRTSTVHTPDFIRDKGALFVPFSPNIISRALAEHTHYPENDFSYPDDIYLSEGYKLIGDVARRPI